MLIGDQTHLSISIMKLSKEQPSESPPNIDNLMASIHLPGKTPPLSWGASQLGEGYEQ
jgi:hypothetical protein